MYKCSLFCAFLLPLALAAQVRRDVAPLKYWPAPLYWQPTVEERELAAKPETSGIAAADVIPLAQTSANSLVFVGMTPCRLVDTRGGFTGAFGPPSLVAGATRSFPLRASTTCSIPSIAQAYSLNVTVIPPGFLGYLTIWPYAAAKPLASTLNDSLGTVVANAASVPAGNDTSGSVEVYVSNASDLVIDINGYYASQSGITLTQGSATAPSLSFAGDAGTGIYSSGTDTVNIVTHGFNRLTVNPIGDVDIPGNILKNGAMFLNGTYANLGLGMLALGSNISGDNDTATGGYALQNNTTGYENTANGSYALQMNTGGEQNTASGAFALTNNTNGILNTAVGALALQGNTQGNYNMASGSWTLRGNTTGNFNTAVGDGALINNSTGNNNTAIGSYSAGNVSGANSNNIHIGSYGASGDSATIRIGGNTALGDTVTQTSFFASGIRNITTGQNNAVPVVIDSNGQLGTVSSSRRYKEDIQDMGDSSSGLMNLRPVTFRYKKPFDDGSKPVQYGLVAEEVAEVYPDLVARSADGQIETVKYQLLDSMLVNELQKQSVTIASQKEQIQAQEQHINSLEERLARVEAALSGSTVTASSR